jgi:hypothetical protein
MYLTCLEHCSSMMTEGEIHDAKSIARLLGNPFKNSGKKLTNHEAGIYRIFSRLLLRQEVRREKFYVYQSILEEKCEKDGLFKRNKFASIGKKKQTSNLLKKFSKWSQNSSD